MSARTYVVDEDNSYRKIRRVLLRLCVDRKISDKSKIILLQNCFHHTFIYHTTEFSFFYHALHEFAYTHCSTCVYKHIFLVCSFIIKLTITKMEDNLCVES